MKKIGLALAGGGVKGSYHLGAYYAFKKCHIKFNGIVGTSIGAANAASLVSGNFYELFNVWKNIDPGTLFGFDQELIDAANSDKKIYKSLLGFLKTTSKILKNKGIDTTNLKEIYKSVIDVDKLYKCNIDFGLATLNISKGKPIYIYKEDIPKEELIDYVMASCSLPIFKLNKIIDDSYYVDGGFIDNCPTKMLLDKNYNIIYEVKVNGIGLTRKLPKNNAKIITISPSRKNGSILEINRKKIIDNIYMGYYDTLKALNKYLGYKYTFKKTLFFNYTKLLKNIPIDKIKHYKKHYKVNSNRNLIIKYVEDLMEQQEYDYNNLYKIKKVIKELKNNNKIKDNFVKNLSI